MPKAGLSPSSPIAHNNSWSDCPLGCSRYEMRLACIPVVTHSCLLRLLALVRVKPISVLATLRARTLRHRCPQQSPQKPRDETAKRLDIQSLTRWHVYRTQRTHTQMRIYIRTRTRRSNKEGKTKKARSSYPFDANGPFCVGLSRVLSLRVVRTHAQLTHEADRSGQALVESAATHWPCCTEQCLDNRLA